jgi:FAD:protein FMN transferase
MTEVRSTFACFGSTCSVLVTGDAGGRTAEEAVQEARERLLSWHAQFTRFEEDSELSQLNADPREEVPVSPDMAIVVAAAVDAARRTGGLADFTLLAEVEEAGYASDLSTSLPLADALALAPDRMPARPGDRGRWREVAADVEHAVVRRPAGMRIDPGGIAKGVFADLLARDLAGHAAFAVDCAGDVLLGGTAGTRRAVNVAGPFDASVVHVFELDDAGIATSGIGRRSWLGGDGLPAHHLIDPSTGRPAYTGVVQATALAPSAARAEALAKAAVLSGPSEAPRWLPHGGVLVFDDGTHRVLAQQLPRVISSRVLHRLAAPALRA